MTYCPRAFQKLRDVFKIDSTQYLLSLCGDQALRELSSPGKSGSVFFISHDDRFIAKTVRREEMRLLMELLPRYYRHVQTYHHTLLVKFFGLYKVKPKFGKRVRGLYGLRIGGRLMCCCMGRCIVVAAV